LPDILCCHGKTVAVLAIELLDVLFYGLCDQVNELDWVAALQQLIKLLEDTLKQTDKIFQRLIKNQLHKWIANFLHYIKV